MKKHITIDSGTSNTRISLVCDGKAVKTLSFSVGATKNIGNRSILSQTVKNGIETLLHDTAQNESDIECVICCGMITSEFGLLELAHIPTPVSIKEMHKNVYKCLLPEIANIPFAFIRGVKSDFSSLETADVMRGEETEVVGAFKGDGLYVLPGSHSKIISVDETCTIKDFKTMLTGEMLFAITQDTILKDAVTLGDFDVDETALKDGYFYAKTHGINEALFKIRLLKTHFGKTDVERYNFLLGVILQDEIDYILSKNAKKIYIGGRKAIKNATALLLKTFSQSEIAALSDTDVENSLISGMLKIYKE